MSKLFKLKEWLTVPEAAKHLSGVFEEEVTEADVLRLALDWHIKLSVNFVNDVAAKSGTVVGWLDTEWKLIPGTPLSNASLDIRTFPESEECPHSLKARWEAIPVDQRSN